MDIISIHIYIYKVNKTISAPSINPSHFRVSLDDPPHRSYKAGPPWNLPRLLQKRRVWNVENDGLLKWRFRDLQLCSPGVFVFRFQRSDFFFGGHGILGFSEPKKFGQFGKLLKGSIWVGRCAGISTMKVDICRYIWQYISLLEKRMISIPTLGLLNGKQLMIWYGRYRDLCMYTIWFKHVSIILSC